AVAEFQLTQAKLADMAVAIDASALLIYRAAWTRDVLATRVTREASMAKLFATESAQQGVDTAVQIWRARRRTWDDGGAALPRDSCVAHLRGNERSAQAGRGIRGARGSGKE